MKIIENPGRGLWKSLSSRPQLEFAFLESSVKNILNRVRKSGDAAVIELTNQFDHVQLDRLSVSAEELQQAETLLSPELKNAIRTAAANIGKFHAAQRREIQRVETMPGVMCWRKEVPIGKIGVYIPGGSAPLFSTVLMIGIPAAIAGCPDIILCTPPSLDGTIDPAILFAAQLAGITKIFRAGGAQAIGALAYGTESIPAVHKIFGPGNQYVTMAKLIVNQQGTAIDMPAGPSEVLVLADKNANPVFVASDLLAQAEHGPDSQVVVVSDSRSLIDEIIREINSQIESLPRKEIAKRCIANSFAITLTSEKERIDFVNEYAPEHLIINALNCDELADAITNAGSVFLGPWSPESAGDYASGTNHTLPTNGYAKAYSGVALESFTKVITFQKITEEGLKTLGPVVEIMAQAEKLEAHKESISVRLRALK